jgi:hypothetical protein
MPIKSPLVNHITKSYIKHHLKFKIEAQKKLKTQIKNQEESIPVVPKSETNISHYKAPAQTPEPELEDPKFTEEVVKTKKRRYIIRKFKNVIVDRHPIVKESKKLVPSRSKCDMIRTSKMIFNLDLVTKKKPHNKSN